MKHIIIVMSIMSLGAFLWSQGGSEGESQSMNHSNNKDFTIREALPEWEKHYSEAEVERAVLAGGCFWGVEAVFEQLEGVLNVDSGYSGGSKETAHYELVGTGATGHAEAVEIVFDPKVISYETLLEVFFTVAHDPTQYNFQGPDVGTEYRSAIFYGDEKQHEAAKEIIAALTRDKVYKAPIVTQVVSLEAFYPAEDYHQDFLRLNPDHGYIVYWDIPKLKDLWEKFPHLVQSQ
ncbi:MAG: peptide-methionine (S)-S-oxide reductase MsrA [Spirochaetales bacterium]|nr:peptide-methionine (S)-S-oxide reductase MsrA [Spirochaetales bacterium]